MLKERIKALGLTVAMIASLLPCMSVNAAHYESVVETRAVINENFDNYEEASYNLTTDYVQMPQNEIIGYKKYKEWNGTVASISPNGKSGNALSIDLMDGGAIKINNNEGTTPLNLGDIIHINFDASYSEEKAGMNLFINDGNKLRFRQVNRNTLNYSPYAKTYKDSPQLLQLSYVNKTISTTGEVPYENNFEFQPDTWANVDVVIDTQDEYFNGEQSIKVTLGNGVWWYGTLDADYTGNDETTVNPYTSFSSLTIDSDGKYAGSEDVVKFDNIKVEITQPVQRKVSDVTTDIMNIDFNNYNTSSNTLKTDYNALADNTNISYKKYKSWATYKIDVTESGKDNTKALKINLDNGGAIKFANPKGTTAVAEGDLIHINYDVLYVGKSAHMLVNLNENAGGTFKRVGYSEDSWIKDYTDSAYSAEPARAGFIDMFFDNGKIGMYESLFGIGMSENEWTNVDIVINTKDLMYDGKQTVKVTANNRFLTGIYDANYTGTEDSVVDRFTEISSLVFDTTKSSYGGTAVTFDNINIEIIKPGFEPWGTAIEGCEDGKFVSGNLTVKAAANASYGSAKENVSLIVAQYDNAEALLDVQLVTREISGGDCLINFDEAVTIGDDTQIVKLFMFELNDVRPYFNAMVLNRAE